ncbi:class I SAM-dependent methyltransferase [Phocaeicola coprocola]|jgi:SAM-dependent methyltransferase|uniref:class I SAM-dependent methyltransferase n=1 Tax=Phocaeicola coprocola TaxID=310298 RepID=UPI003979766D
MNIKNYYGNLCTEMYEILHDKAPQDELDFYLSYAEKNKKILEIMCGSGRFLVPFLEYGYNIRGVDFSVEMLEKLKLKAPEADVEYADIAEYTTNEQFDYIFISSGSVSLFTDMNLCQKILKKIKGLLAPTGKFVFAVDTIAAKCLDNDDYEMSVSVKMKNGFDLVLKTKNYFDVQQQVQFSPGIYELYDRDKLLKSEHMDFQTHLYKFGEMENYLREAGFTEIKTYSSFEKEIAIDDCCDMFLFECNL